MKRFAVLIFLFAVLFSGCDVKVDVKDVFKLPIKITATLEGNEGVFISEILSEQSIVTFEESHVLSGTTLVFTEDGNTATVSDVFTRSIKDGTFPVQETFIKAIRLLSSTESDVIYENGRIRYTIDEMTILVYYDENNDSVTRIETEEGTRRFVFIIASIESYDTQSQSGRIA